MDIPLAFQVMTSHVQHQVLGESSANQPFVEHELPVKIQMLPVIEGSCSTGLPSGGVNFNNLNSFGFGQRPASALIGVSTGNLA